MTLPLPKLPGQYTVRQFRILGLWEAWRDGQIVVTVRGSAKPLTYLRPDGRTWGLLASEEGQDARMLRGNQMLYVSRVKD